MGDTITRLSHVLAKDRTHAEQAWVKKGWTVDKVTLGDPIGGRDDQWPTVILHLSRPGKDAPQRPSNGS